MEKGYDSLESIARKESILSNDSTNGSSNKEIELFTKDLVELIKSHPALNKGEIIFTKTRDESNNYGVNKKIKINNSNLYNIKNTPYVDASEKIYDFANLLEDLKYSLTSFLLNRKILSNVSLYFKYLVFIAFTKLGYFL